jgi:hypothetical protein
LLEADNVEVVGDVSRKVSHFRGKVVLKKCMIASAKAWKPT